MRLSSRVVDAHDFLYGILKFNSWPVSEAVVTVVAEYVHSRHYCHNDIKAQNILLGPGQDLNSVYLVDFGLAYKYKGDTALRYCKM